MAGSEETLVDLSACISLDDFQRQGEVVHTCPKSMRGSCSGLLKRVEFGAFCRTKMASDVGCQQCHVQVCDLSHPKRILEMDVMGTCVIFEVHKIRAVQVPNCCCLFTALLQHLSLQMPCSLCTDDTL